MPRNMACLFQESVKCLGLQTRHQRPRREQQEVAGEALLPLRRWAVLEVSEAVSLMQGCMIRQPSMSECHASCLLDVYIITV